MVRGGGRCLSGDLMLQADDSRSGDCKEDKRLARMLQPRNSHYARFGRISEGAKQVRGGMPAQIKPMDRCSRGGRDAQRGFGSIFRGCSRVKTAYCRCQGTLRL